MTISYNRPNSAIASQSTCSVIRDGKQFEIIVGEELDDRCKESLRFQFTLHQSKLLDELLGSNLEDNNKFMSPESIIARGQSIICVLQSEAYNLPIPTPVTDETLFLRDEIIRLLGYSEVDSLIDEKKRERVELLRARQMEIGIWLYRLPKGWIDLVIN